MSTKRLVLAIGAAVLILVCVIGIWTFYDAWSAGMLPWQPEPTRVVVTPFANLPTPTALPEN